MFVPQFGLNDNSKRELEALRTQVPEALLIPDGVFLEFIDNCGSSMSVNDYIGELLKLFNRSNIDFNDKALLANLAVSIMRIQSILDTNEELSFEVPTTSKYQNLEVAVLMIFNEYSLNLNELSADSHERLSRFSIRDFVRELLADVDNRIGLIAYSKDTLEELIVKFDRRLHTEFQALRNIVGVENDGNSTKIYIPKDEGKSMVDTVIDRVSKMKSMVNTNGEAPIRGTRDFYSAFLLLSRLRDDLMDDDKFIQFVELAFSVVKWKSHLQIEVLSRNGFIISYNPITHTWDVEGK